MKKKVVGVSLPAWDRFIRVSRNRSVSSVRLQESVFSEPRWSLVTSRRNREDYEVGRPWQEAMFLAERVCGICSVVHNTAIVGALEKSAESRFREEHSILRIILNNYDRMQSHLLANYSLLLHHRARDACHVYLLNLRETAMDAIEKMTGTRIMSAYVVPGGVREDVSDAVLSDIISAMDKIERELNRYVKMFETGRLIALRSKGNRYYSLGRGCKGFRCRRSDLARAPEWNVMPAQTILSMSSLAGI